MTLDINLVKRLMDSKVEMLKKAGRAEAEGNTENSKAIEQEWEGVLIDSTLTMSIDDFVKM